MVVLVLIITHLLTSGISHFYSLSTGPCLISPCTLSLRIKQRSTYYSLHFRDYETEPEIPIQIALLFSSVTIVRITLIHTHTHNSDSAVCVSVCVCTHLCNWLLHTMSGKWRSLSKKDSYFFCPAQHWIFCQCLVGSIDVCEIELKSH